jgi:hypothetical protein
VLIQFFSTGDGFWRQKRLEKEWEGIQKRITINRVNGAQGGRPKSLKNIERAKANGSVSPNRNHNRNHNRNETYPDPDIYFNNLESLGHSARARRAPLPRPLDAASGVTEPPPEEYVTTEEVDAIVAVALSKLTGKPVHDPVARKLSTAEAKRESWLDNLAAFVAVRFDGDARMQAWEAIEIARAASNRSAMPKPVRAAIDAIDKLYRESREGAA